MVYEKIDRRSLSTAQQEELRRLAIESIIQGKSKPQVAKELEVCLQSVHNWWNTYQRGIQNNDVQTEVPDIKKILQIRRGRKPKLQVLSAQQLEEIKSIIATYLPRTRNVSWTADTEQTKGLAKSHWQLVESTNHFIWAIWGIDSVWSIQSVQKMILIRYGVELSLGMVNRLLKKWGFIPEDLQQYPKYFRKDEPMITKKKSYFIKREYKYKQVPYYITLFRNPKCDVSSIIAITGKSNIKFVGFKNSVLNKPTLYFRRKVRDSLMQSLILGLQKENKYVHFILSYEILEFRDCINYRWVKNEFSTLSVLA